MIAPERVERIALRVLQVGLPVVFLTPLIYIGETTFPFVVGKVWSFRLLVDLLLPFYVLLVAVAPRYRPRKEPLLIAVGAYMGVLLISAAFGVDPWRSLWSNHERMTGVVAMLHYAAFFLMAATVYRTRREWRMVLLASLGASAIMTVLALWERGHTGFMANTSGRPWATLGNTIYLANYLLFHLYFIAILVVRKSLPPSVRVLLVVLGIAEGIVLLFTQTRGTLLAIIVTGLALLSWLAVREKRYRKTGISLLLAAIIALGVLYANRTHPAVLGIPGFGRLLTTTLSEGGGLRTRFIAWEIALEGFKEKPVVGWGPENFYYVFNAHYNPESYRFGQYETWFDRPHNTLLDVLATTGAVGAAAYLALFVAAFWTLERKIRAGETPKWEGILTGGMLIAYVLQNLTVFDSHTSYLYFFLLLAMIAARPLPEAAPGRALGGAALGAVGAVSAAVGITLAVWLAAVPYQANRYGLLGTSALRLYGDLAQGMAWYDRAIALPTQHRVDLRADGAREVLTAAASSPGTDAGRAALDWAVRRVEENRAGRKDVYDALLLGQIYITRMGFDPTAAQRARTVLEEAQALSPKRQQVTFALVQLALLEGRAADAVALLEASLADEERVRDVHWNLAIAYQAAGNAAGAARAVTRARELGYPWTRGDDLVAAIQIYQQAGQPASALPLAEGLVQAFPKAGNARMLLAEVLFGMGEYERARSEAERARQLDPTLNEAVVLFLSRIP
ncbi:tetratricopeptide repeat protein [Patescibacteria group bacterium]|nr:MAG: tetratricopeptide repeat protein [Patescibacteria group bacterium]